MDGIARNVTVAGDEAKGVVDLLAERLAGDKLKLVVVFADWRLDPYVLAQGLQRALPAPVVGCSTVGVVSREGGTVTAVGFYGDWLRVGVGVASDLTKSPLARSRDATLAACEMLEMAPQSLDPQRHVAITMVDNSADHEEAFCIGSAAAAPQIRIVGGSASTENPSERKGFVWAKGEALADAGVVVLLDSAVPFETVISSHLRRTPAKLVVTAASGRLIHELDGLPATTRLHTVIGELGGRVDPDHPSEYAFARFVGDRPYVRSMHAIEGDHILLASTVEPGHVLHLMRPGDLIAQTRLDLAAVAERVGGRMSSLLAFSCVSRHWEAKARGLETSLADTYAAFPTTGFQTFGEQSGTQLVNHTLTGLAIGTP
jgi:hypothetical protein